MCNLHVPQKINHGGGCAATLTDSRLQWQATADGKTVRALVVINPGNPTGGVLGRENQNDVVQFCEKNKLVLIADEVYQTNVYAGLHPMICQSHINPTA